MSFSSLLDRNMFYAMLGNDMIFYYQTSLRAASQHVGPNNHVPWSHPNCGSTLWRLHTTTLLFEFGGKESGAMASRVSTLWEHSILGENFLFIRIVEFLLRNHISRGTWNGWKQSFPSLSIILSRKLLANDWLFVHLQACGSCVLLSS